MDAISIHQARTRGNVVAASIRLAGADIELCTFPEVRAETVRIVEEQTVLMLGLSRLLPGAEGRIAGDPRRPFARFGVLALRPAGVPLEMHVGQGAFDTLRIRFAPERIGPALEGIVLDDAILAACLDVRGTAIEEAMLRLAGELEHPAPDSADLAEALVSLIVLDLGRYLASTARRSGWRSGGLSARALRMSLEAIAAPGAPPSIDELARGSGLSRHHYIRCFRTSTGMGPGAAIRRRLMDRAKLLLLEDERPIAAIAHDLGYSGAPAFVTAFRRETGHSPGAWRKLML
jgi:AraC-type DNA-binding domain-containing proteins